MAPPRLCRLFLFDLDGTLIDSREDIARAVNAALLRLGLPSLSAADVLRFVGDGIEILMDRALRAVSGKAPDPGQVALAVRIMVQEYEARLFESTRLYPGVRDTLGALQGARLGLISNKLESLSRELLRGFGLESLFSVILGSDSLPRRKPDPLPVAVAMARTGAIAAETVMVGDSRTDILAGKAAGVATCGVTWGFRSREELEAAGCDRIIDSMSELLQLYAPPQADLHHS